MNKIKNKNKLSEDSFYNLQNIFEVILELGYGEFSKKDLCSAIDKLFEDFTDLEKGELLQRTLKIIKIIN